MPMRTEHGVRAEHGGAQDEDQGAEGGPTMLRVVRELARRAVTAQPEKAEPQGTPLSASEQPTLPPSMLGLSNLAELLFSKDPEEAAREDAKKPLDPAAQGRLPPTRR